MQLSGFYPVGAAVRNRKKKMEAVAMPPQIQYIVNDDGQRTAVVIRWEDYVNLQDRLSSDPDLLSGLSELELQALAEGMLSPGRQERLDDLLERNREGTLSDSEQEELDQLLAYIDSMNILKARAIYTLQHKQASQQV
jgi:hypothetical protein